MDSPNFRKIANLMFSLHVGIPRVVPDLLHFIASAGLLKNQPGVHILPKRGYQTKLRRYVNAKGMLIHADIDGFRDTTEFIRDLSRFDLVAISQHALLGAPEEVFVSGKILPRAEARLAKISELLGDRRTIIHVAVTSQFEYLSGMAATADEEVFAAALNKVPSWSELVRRLRSACPERELVVWDFEQPRFAALAFLVTMLDAKDADLIEMIHRKIMKHPDIKHPEFANDSAAGRGFSELPHHTIDRLDGQYEADLLRIEEMEGVSLIRGEVARKVFHT